MPNRQGKTRQDKARQGTSGGRAHARGGIRRTAGNAIVPDRDRAQGLPVVPAGTTPSEAADQAWSDVVTWIRDGFADVGVVRFLERCRCVGEINHAIAVEAPAADVTWLRRRFGKFLGEAVRENTRFTGLWIGVAAEKPQPIPEAF